jgi:hypothetical protein
VCHYDCGSVVFLSGLREQRAGNASVKKNREEIER